VKFEIKKLIHLSIQLLSRLIYVCSGRHLQGQNNTQTKQTTEQQQQQRRGKNNKRTNKQKTSLFIYFYFKFFNQVHSHQKEHLH
jgi:hypothetical protein